MDREPLMDREVILEVCELNSKFHIYISIYLYTHLQTHIMISTFKWVRLKTHLNKKKGSLVMKSLGTTFPFP